MTPRRGTEQGLDPFALVAGSHELIDAGCAIAATDYPGMGADGPASYLIGVSEGNSVLDAVRGARAIPEAHARTDLYLWGHSQGGQAALFAAQQAAAYAPELRLHALAVAAPAADLGELLDDHRDDLSGVTIGSYAFDSLQKVDGPKDASVRLDAVLTPAGQAVVPQIAPRCLLGDIAALHEIAEPAVGDFFAVDPATTEPWKSLLAADTPGGSPIGVPILVTQGDADELVRPTATADFVGRLCAAGEHVTFRTDAGIDHGLIGERTVPFLLTWLAEVRGGQPPSTTCTTTADATPTSTP